MISGRRLEGDLHSTDSPNMDSHPGGSHLIYRSCGCLQRKSPQNNFLHNDTTLSKYGLSLLAMKCCNYCLQPVAVRMSGLALCEWAFNRLVLRQAAHDSAKLATVQYHLQPRWKRASVTQVCCSSSASSVEMLHCGRAGRPDSLWLPELKSRSLAPLDKLAPVSLAKPHTDRMS
jgi:hypothetical protein